jgi:hypothetical protein
LAKPGRAREALLRLTLLKRWFERPGRLEDFALWIVSRATARGRAAAGAAADLFRRLHNVRPAQNLKRSRFQ